MKTQSNTDGSANSLGGIVKDIRQKAKKSLLFASALKKLVNSSEEEISAFLGETKKQVLKNLFFVCDIMIWNVAEFIVGEKFQNNAKDKVGVQLYFGTVFTNLILKSMKDSKVSLSKKTKLKKFSLMKDIHDAEIQSELKSPNPIDVEIFFPLIWNMLSLQKNGEVSKYGLVTNGFANIFHVKLKDNSVVTVHVDRRAEAWNFVAGNLNCLDRRFAGHAFFTLATI